MHRCDLDSTYYQNVIVAADTLLTRIQNEYDSSATYRLWYETGIAEYFDRDGQLIGSEVLSSFKADQTQAVAEVEKKAIIDP